MAPCTELILFSSVALMLSPADCSGFFPTCEWKSEPSGFDNESNKSWKHVLSLTPQKKHNTISSKRHSEAMKSELNSSEMFQSYFSQMQIFICKMSWGDYKKAWWLIISYDPLSTMLNEATTQLFSLPINLLVIFLTNKFSFVYKWWMMKNVDRCLPKTKIASSNIWSCPQPEDIEIRNQKEFTF